MTSEADIHRRTRNYYNWITKIVNKIYLGQYWHSYECLLEFRYCGSANTTLYLALYSNIHSWLHLLFPPSTERGATIVEHTVLGCRTMFCVSPCSAPVPFDGGRHVGSLARVTCAFESNKGLHSGSNERWRTTQQWCAEELLSVSCYELNHLLIQGNTSTMKVVNKDLTLFFFCIANRVWKHNYLNSVSIF